MSIFYKLLRYEYMCVCGWSKLIDDVSWKNFVRKIWKLLMRTARVSTTHTFTECWMKLFGMLSERTASSDDGQILVNKFENTQMTMMIYHRTWVHLWCKTHTHAHTHTRKQHFAVEMCVKTIEKALKDYKIMQEYKCDRSVLFVNVCRPIDLLWINDKINGVKHLNQWSAEGTN